MEKHQHPLQGRAGQGSNHPSATAETQVHDGGAQTIPSGLLKDPVCVMNVTAQSKNKHEHAGRPYYFCSAGCKTKFVADTSEPLNLRNEPPLIAAGSGQVVNGEGHSARPVDPGPMLHQR
jgi:YHS domain-containing protein